MNLWRLYVGMTRTNEMSVHRYTVASWQYCPECGCDKLHHQEGELKQCANCYQEYFDSVNYSEVVRHNLSKLFTKAKEAKPSAPRVVSADKVDRARGVFLAELRNHPLAMACPYEAMRAALEAFATSMPAARVPDGLSAWVGDMKTSAGMDYYVCVGFRDSSEYLTPNLYKIRGRAEFDVAEWNHLLGLGPKPDILAFDTESAAPKTEGKG